MRYSGDWMVLADDRILEFIREEGSGRPKAMVDSGYVRFSRPYITQRCKALVEHGLLQHLGNGVYVMTDRGERYLDGKVDTSEDALDAVESPLDEDESSADGTEESV